MHTWERQYQKDLSEETGHYISMLAYVQMSKVMTLLRGLEEAKYLT